MNDYSKWKIPPSNDPTWRSMLTTIHLAELSVKRNLDVEMHEALRMRLFDLLAGKDAEISRLRAEVERLSVAATAHECCKRSWEECATGGAVFGPDIARFWKARAETAEAEVERLRAALRVCSEHLPDLEWIGGCAPSSPIPDYEPIRCPLCGAVGVYCETKPLKFPHGERCAVWIAASALAPEVRR